MLRKILSLMVLSTVISLSLFAGTTGRLAGRVSDENGKPVPFASVIIPSIQMGANSDANGAYVIVNIPPGKYDVNCQRPGFQSQKVEGVQINLDETTVQNFVMSTQIIDIGGVTVSAAKIEKVSATKTNSGTTLTSETIDNLTVTDIDDIVAINPGANVVNGELHVRGGRANEVSYQVDGMSVSDPVDGGAALSIDSDAIEQTKVLTGGFAAEYGNAQSGIVNIITKSGSKDYSGKIELNSDHLVGGDNSNSDLLKFSFGGPLFTPAISSLRDKLTFFMSGTGNWYDTRYKDYYISDPVHDFQLDGNIFLMNAHFAEHNPYENRKEVAGFDIGENRNFNDYSLNFKSKYKISPTQSLTMALRGDQKLRDPYFHVWKYALDHYLRTESSSQQYIFTYDRMIGNSANIKVKGSMYGKQYKAYPKGVPEDIYFKVSDDWNIDENNLTAFDSLAIIDNDPIDAYTLDGVIGPEKDYDWEYLDSSGEVRPIGPFVQPGSIAGTYIDDENKTYDLRTDIEYALPSIHTFKTGIEIIKHYIRKDQLFTPWVVDEYRYRTYLNNVDPLFTIYPGQEFKYYDAATDDWTIIIDSTHTDTMNFYSAEDKLDATLIASGETDGYEAHPWQGAYYLQDSMQWEGMSVNAGLRFDFWYLGSDYKKFQNDGSYELIKFDKVKKFRVMISPRLGISHPISETTVLHFAYNYQNQLPQMQYIFTSKSPSDAITSNQAVTIGNPELDPQITITYEVGLSKQLGENYVMDVQAYYKNIYNYVNRQKVFWQQDGSLIPYSENPQDQSVPMYRWISEDYGSIRGIDLNLQRSLANFISGSASYSLAWAQGNNSGAVIQDEATNLREFPLDWDIRHSFSLNLSFSVLDGEEWYLPLIDKKFPMDDFGVSFSYNLNSGTPYTPQTYEGRPLDTNSNRQDYTEDAALKVNKKIRFGESTYLKLYMDISNLFNRKNVRFVYPKTGSPYYDGANLDTDNDGYVSSEAQYIHDMATKDPVNVSSGRVISFGMSFNW